MVHKLPSLNALRAFEAVARLESVSKAGHELHVTHGAVSRQIRTLEAELDIALFVREGRGLALTPAGRQLRDASAGAFEQLRQCCQTLQRQAKHAPLVLGCSSSVLARWVIPRLQRLRQDLPDTTLHLTAMEGFPTPALTGIDAALLIGEPPWPATWRVHVVGHEHIGPVLSPHRDKPCTSDLAALCREPLLHTTSRPQAWPTWAKAHAIAPEDLHMGQSFAHLYYLLEAAVAGLGVAIAPQALVADDMAAGRLVAPWGFHATGGQWALCARKDADGPRLAALAEWLQNELQT